MEEAIYQDFSAELEDDDDDEAEGGVPAWVVTFADLMTLLMCFFVLLVAFSEMDVQRYRMIAGSMKMAFGVQREFRAFEPPKGTSMIAQEFSPGKPMVAPVPAVRQFTVEDKEQTIDFDTGKSDTTVHEEIRRDIASLTSVLAVDIDKGLIQVEGFDDRIVIRIEEEGLFGSGRAKLKRTFVPMLRELGIALNEMGGTIAVGGHTDDRPIRTARYRSNWDLSSARAASVVHELRESSGIESSRLIAQGFADSHPVVPNIDRESRAKNRRVEISVIRKLSGL